MTDSMRCVHFVGDGKVEVRDVPVPEPRPGEALVRIAVSAICGSELGALRSGTRWTETSHNPGHEMAGTIVWANGLSRFQAGERVGLQIMSGCGRCIYCLQGEPKHCEAVSFVLDAHAESVVAPEMSLVPLPDDVDWEAAVLMCGDTLATPYHALKLMGGVRAGERAVVFGLGPIGLGALTWLKHFGLPTTVSEVNPYRRELARRLGADLVLDPAQEDVVGRIREETRGGADVCLDCSGLEQTLLDALAAARIRGRVGSIGEKPAATISPSGQMIHKELQMTGSWYFTRADFYEQVEHLRRGLALSDVITHRYPLESAQAAYDAFVSGNTGKVVFIYP